ncbi:membrane metallo-endopeptidase-like 1 isoform X2 [Dermacentor albipictus]|uniref:membrane metallo-endopeptidase-like 1 isoform X2 n=1 Tax=Dermacentor albipictus TaxID=60249 RepID=UPI0031FD7A89
MAACEGGGDVVRPHRDSTLCLLCGAGRCRRAHRLDPRLVSDAQGPSDGLPVQRLHDQRLPGALGAPVQHPQQDRRPVQGPGGLRVRQSALAERDRNGRAHRLAGALVRARRHLPRKAAKTIAYSLHMAYSEVSVHRAKWLNYSKAYGKRLEYVRSMYRLYGAGDTPLAQLRDLVADEDAWVRAVTDGIASSNRVIMKLRLAHLDQLTPNVSSHRWLDYLNEHLRPHRLSPDDKLLLVDKIVSTVTNNLFERFSNAAILEQVAWRFIQDYSYANSYAAAVATFGNIEAVARFRPRNCYSFTESRFQKWLFVWRVREQLQPPLLSTVNAIFEDLRNTTQQLLSDAAPWIDPAARIEAVAILQRLHLEPFWSLFGAEGFKPTLPLGAIRKYLDAFPTQFSSPLKGWMQAADLHRRTFPGWPLNDSLLHRHGEYSFPVQYDYWWNSVFLHLAVAAPPMFYTDAPASVNYAAFGTAVARQLVRGFDPQKGAFLDSNRTVRSWMSRATREELQKKISCAGGRSSVLMDVAAAQVAYRAFQEHRAAEPRRYAVSKDISLTPDMLFFVTLCRSLCGRGELCPKVLSNMAAFSRAFSCKPDAPMNRADKCSFFEQA